MSGKIFDIISPCGYENKLREFLIDRFNGIFDEVKTDNIGNLILKKNGQGKKICLECGMDSAGVMIVSLEADKAYFSAVGRVEPWMLEDKMIGFLNGATGIVRYDGEDIKNAKISDLYLEIDSGVVKIGDFGACVSDFRETEEKIFSNNLSEKIAICVVMEAIQRLNKSNCDLTVVFSAQKRLGARGVLAFLSENKFDMIITVDSIGCEKNIKMGSGCQIIAKDKGGLSDITLRRYAEEVSLAHKIDYSTVVCGDNVYLENIAASGNSQNTIALAIPVKHKNKRFEYVLKSDVDLCAQLIEALCADLK